MRIKEEILNEIKEIDRQIEFLQKDKNKRVDELSKLPMDKAEKLQHVLNYGSDNSYLISRTSNGLIDMNLDRYNRHETVDVSDMIEYIMESYYCETYEDHLEILELLSETPITQEKYDDYKEYQYNYAKPKQMFIDMIDDVIKAGVREFEFDW